MRFSVIAIVILLFSAAAHAQQSDPFAKARKLEQAGKNEQAFRAYLAIPGAQHAALRIARSEPGKYIAILKGVSKKTSEPGARLVHAGKKMLPAVHKALRSQDRIVRANAARAAGAIGSSSSIEHLLKALDLESGLSRGAIVWALGKQKAAQALPQLEKLYVDAKRDEQRRRGSGFRAAQSAAVIHSHYETICGLETIDSEWNELKATAKPKIDPRRNEPLLSVEDILEAIRKIGPAKAQEFYRKLAGEQDIRVRQEAAVGLAEARGKDREQSLTILSNLLADRDMQVRMRSAVSLLILGQKKVRKPILAWLKSPKPYLRQMIIWDLMRTKTSRQIAFARKQIEACSKDKALDSHVQKAARELLTR